MESGIKDLYVGPQLVLFHLKGETDQEILEEMGQHFYKQKMVKESYVQAVKERELIYPTGLQCDGLGVAIPHTDSEHVEVQAMEIGILSKTVDFKQMGTDDMIVPVKIILMLAIKEPKKQVEFLQKLMTFLESGERLSKLMEAESELEVVQIFQDYFVE